VDPRSALPPIRFPVAGNWLVLNPPGHPPHAYDISRLGPGGRLTSAPLWRIVVGRARPDEIFGWQTPVEAPVAGHVVEATDGIDDRMRLNPLVDVPASLLIRPARAKGDLAQLAGNHVVIESGGLYVVLAHLRRGSLAVREGQHIDVGAVAGRNRELGKHPRAAPASPRDGRTRLPLGEGRPVPHRSIRALARSPMGAHARRAAASPPRSDPNHAGRLGRTA
jgi:hypothetical protein